MLFAAFLVEVPAVWVQLWRIARQALDLVDRTPQNVAGWPPP